MMVARQGKFSFLSCSAKLFWDEFLGYNVVGHLSQSTFLATRNKERTQILTQANGYAFFPDEVRQQLPPLYSTEHETDPIVRVKFFHPLASMTWYATEGSPVDEDGFYDTDKPKVDYLFYGWVFNDESSELGYWSLSIMEAVEVMGLNIERDVNFTPTPLSVVKSWHQERVL